MPILLQLLGTIKLVLLQMWRRWYVIAVCVILCVAFVVAKARLSAPQYVISMVVTAPESGSSGLSGALSALSASTGLGLSGSMGRASQFESYLALLQSANVSQELMHDPHIMKLLFGSAVNPVTGEWKDSFSRHRNNMIFAAFGIHRSPKPTVDDVHSVLNVMLVINVAPMNRNMATITCTSSNPYKCRELLLAADHAAQARLDAIAQENAQRMTVYLESILSKVNEVTLRQALTNVMASTEVQAVMSSVSEQQRAVVLDAPIVPSTPAYPKPMVLISLAILMGLVLGGSLTWFARDTAFDRFVAEMARRLRLSGQTQ
jgi:hypothetical protein